MLNPHVRAVVEYLKDAAILLHERPLGDNLMYRCPFHHGDSENFGVHTWTGQWNCFKCKKRGRSAGELLEALGVRNSGITAAKVYNFVDIRVEVLRAFEVETTDFVAERAEASQQVSLPVTCRLSEAQPAADYILSRGMDVDLLDSFGVLYSPYGEYGRRIILPWYDVNGLSGFSARSIDNNDYTRKMLRPKGSRQELFSYNPTGLPIKGATVVLTEGEFSALAIAHLRYHARALFGSYLHPGQINSLLEAEEIIFFLDGDEAGRSEAKRAALKLSGFVPCVRICEVPDRKDPADLFLENPENLRLLIERRPENPDILAQLKIRL